LPKDVSGIRGNNRHSAFGRPVRTSGKRYNDEIRV
jgi:hypothetical protein